VRRADIEVWLEAINDGHHDTDQDGRRNQRARQDRQAEQVKRRWPPSANWTAIRPAWQEVDSHTITSERQHGEKPPAAQTITTATTPAPPVELTDSASGAGDLGTQKSPAAYLPTTASLGLRFDERRRLVTRDGYDGVKTSLLDRPQLWELLLELEAAGDMPLERGELAAGCRKRVWKDRPGDDESVLRSALSTLRSRLKPLGLRAAGGGSTATRPPSQRSRLPPKPQKPGKPASARRQKPLDPLLACLLSDWVCRRRPDGWGVDCGYKAPLELCQRCKQTPKLPLTPRTSLASTEPWRPSRRP